MNASDSNFLDLGGGWRYWFVRGEFTGDGRASHHPDDLRMRLCEAAAKLNRWGGWSQESVSLARHSLLVAAFVYARCEVAGWPAEQLEAALREAAVHDLHEPLGLGDVLSPVLRWLREQDVEPVDELIFRGEAAVRGLFGLLPASPEIRRIVKLADHDAAAVERGYACNDAPEWLGPRVALARHALRQHSMSDGLLAERLMEILLTGASAVRQECAQDWLLRRLGFGTPESRARLVELTGVPS